MIEHIEITGVGAYSPDDNTKKYIRKKIGSLDRLAPRHARKTMHARVTIEQVDLPNGNKYQAEAIITVPDKQLAAKDSTVNVLAAIDIVEAKLAGQLRRYKQESLPHIGRRRLLSRFKRSYARESS